MCSGSRCADTSVQQRVCLRHLHISDRNTIIESMNLPRQARDEHSIEERVETKEDRFFSQILNISSSSGNVRAYGFRGSAPSPFAAEQCDSGSGAMQLLMINLNDEENTTVSLEDCRPPGAGGKYAAWVLTPPSATAAAGGSSTLVRKTAVYGDISSDETTSICPDRLWTSLREIVPVQNSPFSKGVAVFSSSCLFVSGPLRDGCISQRPPAAGHRRHCHNG